MLYSDNFNFLNSIQDIKKVISKQIDKIKYLNNIYSLYKTDTSKIINSHTVHHDKLMNFCFNFDKFNKNVLPEDRYNEFLYKVVSNLARFRYKSTKTPLPFGHLFYQNIDNDDLQKTLIRIKNLFPAYYELIVPLCDELNLLTN